MKLKWPSAKVVFRSAKETDERVQVFLCACTYSKSAQTLPRGNQRPRQFHHPFCSRSEQRLWLPHDLMKHSALRHDLMRAAEGIEDLGCRLHSEQAIDRGHHITGADGAVPKVGFRNRRRLDLTQREHENSGSPSAHPSMRQTWHAGCGKK